MRSVILVVAVLSAACGSEKKADPGPALAPAQPDPAGSAVAPAVAPNEQPTQVEPEQVPEPSVTMPHKPARPTAEVKLVLSGAVSATLAGTGGSCACNADSATYQLKSDDFKVQPSFALTLLVTSPEEWKSPSIVLNVRSPQRGSWSRNRSKHRPEDKLAVAKDCSGVTLDDVVLRGVGSQSEVKLKGTIRCGG